MAKMTIDDDIQGSMEPLGEDRVQKAFQVARATLTRLKEINYRGRIEIIKVTWEYSLRGHLCTNFQVVFRPLSLHETMERFSEKLQVTAQWDIPGGKIWTYRDEGGERKPIYPSTIELSDEEIDTLVAGVIETMQAAIAKRQEFFKDAAERLDIAGANLASLAKVPAKT